MTVVSLQDYKNNKNKSNVSKAFEPASDLEVRIQKIKESINRINSLMSELRDSQKDS